MKIRKLNKQDMRELAIFFLGVFIGLVIMVFEGLL